MTSTSSIAMQSLSPLTLLQNELTSEVSAGTISSSDQSALSSALTEIDTQMKSERATGGSPPSPGDMQSKIDDLISTEVSNGKLTSGQAEELKNVFAKAFQGGQGAGPGGPGGPGGPPPNAGANAGGGTQGSSDSDTSNMLSNFLKSLQDSQGSSSGYSTTGNSLLSQIQSLIVNYQA